MKKINKLTLVLLLVSHTSFADITGAGDAAILGQLVTQTGKIVDQLNQAKEALNVSKYMQEAERLKQVKQLSQTGAKFAQLLDDMDGLNGADSWDDPFGLKSVTGEIETLESEIESAKNKGDKEKSRRYARILKNLKKVKFLGEANKKSQSSVASGANESDLVRVSAESSLIMSSLLQSKEEREIKEQLQKEKGGEIAENFFTKSLTYSSSREK